MTQKTDPQYYQWAKDISKFVLPILFAVYLFMFTVSVCGEFDGLSSKEWFQNLSKSLDLGFWGRFFFWLALTLSTHWLFRESPGSVSQSRRARINFRYFLAFFFLLYGYVVANGLIPLPDEPPRISFWGAFCVVASVVFAYHALVSPYRLFLAGTWFFLYVIAPAQLEKEVKFLEMMLEPNTIETVTFHTLGFVFAALITPAALRAFPKTFREYRASAPLFFRKGFPF